MNFERAERIARAVLHEGYLLYPYRPSALKNRHRWTFGCVFPPAWEHEPSVVQTQCLVVGGKATALTVRVRFFQLHPDRGAVEREVLVDEANVCEFVSRHLQHPFAFPAETPLAGEVGLKAEEVVAGAFRLTLTVRNLTPFEGGMRANRDDALMVSLVSCHALLGIERGRFVSLLDPPTELREAATTCRNRGLWPVLVGEPGRNDLMLAAPIILEDHPRIAAESPGDTFDATEIDEMLALRILTLTESEKREMAAADPRTRSLLERTEALTPERLLLLHGVCRTGKGVYVGSRVRLKPRPGGDVFDLTLAGRVAVVTAIDEDHEGNTHLSVAVEGDPGMDLGMEGKPGHRFFFSPDEVEVID